MTPKPLDLTDEELTLVGSVFSDLIEAKQFHEKVRPIVISLMQKVMEELVNRGLAVEVTHEHN